MLFCFLHRNPLKILSNCQAVNYTMGHNGPLQAIVIVYEGKWQKDFQTRVIKMVITAESLPEVTEPLFTYCLIHSKSKVR